VSFMKNNAQTLISMNLKRIRNIKQLTQEIIAEKSGLSRNAYRSIEKGEAEPRSNTLQNIAKALEVSIFDLLRPLPVLASLRFRSGKSLTGRNKDKRQEHINDFAYWLKNFNFIESELKNKIDFKLKDIAGTASIPIDMAKLARKHLGLDEKEPVHDICGLIESAGIKIYQFKSDIDNLFGFCLSNKDGGPAIGVNIAETISVERKIFTVTHELGHILLHVNSFDSKEDVENNSTEKEADVFASHFLMPQKAFDSELQKNSGLHWIKRILHIKRIFKVSYRTVIMRLIEMGKADSSIWQNFAIEHKRLTGKSLANHHEPESLSNKDFSAQEPAALDNIDFTETRLQFLVRKAFERDIITMSRAAEILNISLPDMRDLAKNWGALNG